jgi:hypothetical protein
MFPYSWKKISKYLKNSSNITSIGSYIKKGKYMNNYLLGTTEVVLNPMWTTIPEVLLEAYKDKTAWKANATELIAYKSFLQDSYMHATLSA